MKNKIIKLIIILLIIIFICIGFYSPVNLFLKEHISKEQYIFLVITIVYFVVELKFYLKINSGLNGTFKLLEADIDFRRYKKEKKYKEDKSFYYRDLPFNKDIFKIFWIAFQYKIINNRANILNALLLKWCKEKRLKFRIDGKYEIMEVDKWFDSENEAYLFALLRGMSKDRFIHLTLFNSKPIFKKINDIFLEETEKLKTENKVANINGQEVILTSIKPDVDIVFGFKNFLLNFGSIQAKTPEEVHLWDEYLIYAELLGIADKVKNEFQKFNIDYSLRETKIKRVNRGITNGLKFLFIISYLTVGLFFILLTAVVWIIYIQITWG